MVSLSGLINKRSADKNTITLHWHFRTQLELRIQKLGTGEQADKVSHCHQETELQGGRRQQKARWTRPGFVAIK